MVNNFGLFFTRDNLVLRLPVNPEKLPVARAGENSEYNVLGLGPIVAPRAPSLREVSISSFFPGRVFPGVLTSGGFEPPEFYIQFFESAMKDKAPILYTPVRYYENGEPYMSGDTGFKVLVTQFNSEERAGETGDFYYELTLTEYRDYAPLVVKIAQEVEGPATAEKEREMPENQLAVGTVCIANGRFYASSYGEKPFGNGNGRRCVISRIITNDPARPYPIHITTESGGWLGWLTAGDLQVVK